MSEEKTVPDVTLKVEDAMTSDIITINMNATVKRAAKIMDKNEISCLITSRKEKAIDIITERDPLKHIIVESKNPEKTKVKEVMSTPLEVVAPGTDLEKALKLIFRKKIKKLPVVDEATLLGLVSLRGIARCQPAMINLLRSLTAARKTPKSMKKSLITTSYNNFLKLRTWKTLKSKDTLTYKRIRHYQ